MFLRYLSIGASLAVIGLASASVAQETPPSRFPADGIAILNCEPPKPAPADSCVLRVPPNQLRSRLSSAQVGDQKGSFEFADRNDRRLPSGIALSETIILVDLTPGPGGQRRGTFSAEKALIRQFAEELPQGRVAVYGFNEELVRLTNFTTDRQTVLKAIDDLTLSGTNTLIATYTEDVINILANRNSAILKQVFVISDGEEEGTGDLQSVARTAIEANVTVSAVGTFWRAVGSAQIATGRDYLRALTEPTLGSRVELLLRRPAEARDLMEAFADSVKSASEGSGLILPVGDVFPADITVTMKVPVQGVAGSFRDEDIRVRFTPVKATPDEIEATEPQDEASAVEKEVENTIFGYPAVWVYSAAGAGVLLLLLLLVLIIRRQQSAGEDREADDFDGDDVFPDAGEATRVVPAPRQPAQRASAYLVQEGSSRKLPLFGQRVSIGRGSSNSLIIDHDSISRVQAEIVRNRDGGFTLSDLDSLNGTFINNRRLSGAGIINPGDAIKFGEVSFRLTLP